LFAVLPLSAYTEVNGRCEERKEKHEIIKKKEFKAIKLNLLLQHILSLYTFFSSFHFIFIREEIEGKEKERRKYLHDFHMCYYMSSMCVIIRRMRFKENRDGKNQMRQSEAVLVEINGNHVR